MTGPLLRLETVGSTQDELHRLADGGAADGTAVAAVRQEAGRGSRGRAWDSPPGGLWLSVLRRAEDAGIEVLSLRVGLALARAIEGAARLPPVEIKWPNDLMIGLHKVGGILCEARWQGDRLAWVAIGLGVNVTNPVPEGLDPPAGSLAEHDPSASVEGLLEPVVAAMRALPMDRPTLSPAELAEFGRRDWLRGRYLRAPATGRGAGVRDDGALLIEPPGGGLEAIASGTVRLAHPT